MPMFTNTHPITISGLAELAEDLPDDDWYELRVRLRKCKDGTAEIYVVKTITPLYDVYRLDGEFWYRNKHDELNVLND